MALPDQSEGSLVEQQADTIRALRREIISLEKEVGDLRTKIMRMEEEMRHNVEGQ